ncbi:MAG: adenylate/guanylate cyclase domain-containing protein [Desulfobacterales bacterium]
MKDTDFKRKLTAILSADVKGYSRLMSENEAATVRTITRYRQVVSELTEQHRGRVVDSPGDNLLAEFASVVDAVDCAVKIQKEIKVRNAALSDNRRMEFRIGVNLGDVIQEGARIYGDGVNIAARIEGLAEAGGICISRTVYDQVKSKLDLDYAYQGEHAVKNITEPVRVYQIKMESEEGAPEMNREDKLPDKPSIAVLPFTNMSRDPDQEYFSDGITEDIITDLSKISALFVIARNSSFTFKGRAVKVDEVGRKLGVRYVLEGSVRKAGNRVRITAQLIDAKTEGHLWAERYDRDLEDIFALQDEVTQKIVVALAVKLTHDEQERLEHRETENLEAYDYTLRGLEYCYRYTKEDNAQAQLMFAKAIELDPKYALAYAWLGRSHWMDWVWGWNQDSPNLEQVLELTQKAIALDDTLPPGHCLLADIYLWTKEHAQAIAEAEKAIALNSNDADGLAGLGGILTFAGRSEEALDYIKKGMLLNPAHPVWYLWNLGHAYFWLDRYEEAIATFKQALERSPNFNPAIAFLSAIYWQLGRKAEARTVMTQFLGQTSQPSPEYWRDKLPYQDEADLKRVMDAFAGAMPGGEK